MKHEPRMTSNELTAIGTALYGDSWMTSLASEIGYEYSTVWRWATGKTPTVPPRPAKTIRTLAKRKKIALA